MPVYPWRVRTGTVAAVGVSAEESRRPTLYGRRHAISSGHYLASAAGFAVLEAGGNAVDAGVAAGIALGVICADEVNVAGVAPILIREPSGAAVSIAGLGHWPAGVPAHLFMQRFAGAMPEGIHQTVVPAAPDAWITAVRDHGTWRFADVAAAAIRIARDGFAVYDYLAAEIAANAASYARWEQNAAIFLPGGRPPAVGDRFVQADLAATLECVADAERARGGTREDGLAAARAAFYEGEIAHAIAAYHAEHGGYLTLADLAAFRSRYEPVVRTRWRDFEVLTCGPWCQGPTLAQALVTLERAQARPGAFDDPAWVHLVLEVLKGVFADREYRYGDPAFVEVGLDQLLSHAHADARLGLIDPQRATPGMPGPVGYDVDLSLHLPEPGRREASRPRDTSYVCVIDADGRAFSATPSDGSYACPVIPGLVPGLPEWKRRVLTDVPYAAYTGMGVVVDGAAENEWDDSFITLVQGRELQTIFHQTMHHRAARSPGQKSVLNLYIHNRPAEDYLDRTDDEAQRERWLDELAAIYPGTRGRIAGTTPVFRWRHCFAYPTADRPKLLQDLVANNQTLAQWEAARGGNRAKK